jgi:hypothetical protein
MRKYSNLSNLTPIKLHCNLLLIILCLDSLKSELERLEEEAMISELIELVERRDQLLWALHLEKGR